MSALSKNLREYGVIKEGHFKLNSGRHSNFYINKDSIYSCPELFREITNTMIGLIMREKLFDFSNPKGSVITGPAIAGAVLAAPIANSVQVPFVYPEKSVYGSNTVPGTMVFNRGYDKVLSGKDVIIVEDIVTTGDSIFKTIDAIRKCGGFVTSALCIWNRGNVSLQESDGINLYSLIDEIVESYEPSECPLCGVVPLTNPKDGSIIDVDTIRN